MLNARHSVVRPQTFSRRTTAFSYMYVLFSSRNDYRLCGGTSEYRTLSVAGGEVSLRRYIYYTRHIVTYMLLYPNNERNTSGTWCTIILRCRQGHVRAFKTSRRRCLRIVLCVSFVYVIILRLKRKRKREKRYRGDKLQRVQSV